MMHWHLPASVSNRRMLIYVVCVVTLSLFVELLALGLR